MILVAARISHFGAMLIFALLVSIAFACVGRHTTATRVKFALLSFFLFVAIGLGIAWLMYPLSR
jgi:hypothetical protein